MPYYCDGSQKSGVQSGECFFQGTSPNSVHRIEGDAPLWVDVPKGEQHEVRSALGHVCLLDNMCVVSGSQDTGCGTHVQALVH